MAMKAYVLIEAEVGKAGEVAEAVQKVAGVKSADTVTGPYDVVAAIEVADIDAVGTVVKQIHSVTGVGKTITCIGVKYS
ncbi:MAG: Lrp/AsnC ligand binding domain-containing protein [Dehalococcoidales bacterium]|nr:Lrp/AsnC ligand binding domain-containing protein [Dehalococcoidales bacterium]